VETEKLEKQCHEVAALLKAMSHPQRLMIMCYLAEGEKNVSEILELCQISQSQMSQFLNRMQREKLLKMRKEGNFSYYSVSNPKVLSLLKSLQKSFCF